MDGVPAVCKILLAFDNEMINAACKASTFPWQLMMRNIISQSAGPPSIRAEDLSILRLRLRMDRNYCPSTQLK